MSNESNRVLTLTWVALLGLSLLNFYLAEIVLTGTLLVTAIWVAAFVKLGLVTAVFMELWHHGRAWLFVALALFGLTIGLLLSAG